MATLPVRHHRCPECGDRDHLYAEAECRWSHEAQQWVLGSPEDNPKTECTTCDWQGHMSDTELEEYGCGQCEGTGTTQSASNGEEEPCPVCDGAEVRS